MTGIFTGLEVSGFKEASLIRSIGGSEVIGGSSTIGSDDGGTRSSGAAVCGSGSSALGSLAGLFSLAFLLGLGLLKEIEEAIRVIKDKYKYKPDEEKDLPRYSFQYWDLRGSRFTGR